MQAQNKTSFCYTGNNVKKTADTCNNLPGRMKKQYLFHIPRPFYIDHTLLSQLFSYNLYLLQTTRAQFLPRGKWVFMPPCCSFI
jgi:hypothetical protein